MPGLTEFRLCVDQEVNFISHAGNAFWLENAGLYKERRLEPRDPPTQVGHPNLRYLEFDAGERWRPISLA